MYAFYCTELYKEICEIKNAWNMSVWLKRYEYNIIFIIYEYNIIFIIYEYNIIFIIH